MNGQEFKAWREGFGLTQAAIGDKLGVTRTTIQNWEAFPGSLPPAVEASYRVWDRQLRQQDPGRGPVTLIYSNGPLHIDPYGPRRPMAMLKQEAHPSNAAVLARARMLAGRPDVFNPFVMEDGGRDLWNVIELQRVMDGKNPDAPTLPNLLRWLADGIRADAPNFVRSGPRVATPQEVDERTRALVALAIELDRIADQPVLGVLTEQRGTEAVMAQARNLGIRPRDALVNAIAQAFVAARMPTADFPNQVY